MPRSGEIPRVHRAAPRRVSLDDLSDFTQALLQRAGATGEVAESVAAGLGWASLRGVDSHGVRLLPHYVRALRAGRINGSPQFIWSGTSQAVVTLNADNSFGHAAGDAAVCAAMARLLRSGIAAVSVNHSSHFGAAGYFANQIANQGFIGLAFTHADSLLKSHDGRRAFFGTNPIAFAAPMEGEEPLSLDMATSQISWNKVLEHRAAGDELEPGWAVDRHGQTTEDPELAAALAPAGGYKGVGLAMMIEVLCSLLSGMPYGRDISRMYDDPLHRPRHLGHFFVAIDPSAFPFATDFSLRLRAMANALRAEPGDPNGGRVRAPGDPQKECASQRTAHGIPLPDALWAEFRELSEAWAVALPNILPSHSPPGRQRGANLHA